MTFTNTRIFLPIITSLLFAFSFVAAKYTTIDLLPLTTSLLRYIVALAFLCGMAIIAKKNLSITGKDIPIFIVTGLCGIVGYHYFFFMALRYTVVANTAIINASNPIITGLLAAIFIRERLNVSNYLGIMISVTGVIILLFKGQMTNLLTFNFVFGDMLMLLAVVSWAVYTIFVKQLLHRYSGFTITFYAVLFGVLLLCPLALSEPFFKQVQNISLSSILSVIYMGVGASGVGYLLYNYSIKKIGPTKTSSFVYSLVPIFVSILALLFFSESITIIMLLSSLLVIVGLNLMLRDSR